MQIVPSDLLCFKISNTRLLALQCSNAGKTKKLISPMILTEYLLYFPKDIFNVQQITTSGGKFNICWQGHGQQSTAQSAPKHAISSKKIQFLGGV